MSDSKAQPDSVGDSGSSDCYPTMAKWGYGTCPYCEAKDELLYWVRGDLETLQCEICCEEGCDEPEDIEDIYGWMPPIQVG